MNNNFQDYYSKIFQSVFQIFVFVYFVFNISSKLLLKKIRDCYSKIFQSVIQRFIFVDFVFKISSRLLLKDFPKCFPKIHFFVDFVFNISSRLLLKKSKIIAERFSNVFFKDSFLWILSLIYLRVWQKDFPFFISESSIHV